MGQHQSVTTADEPGKNITLTTPTQGPSTGEKTMEQCRYDTFNLWPGLEGQLEVLFRSLDLDDTGLLPYSTLEPVLRHQLMQIGLIEYITRFANANGSLNAFHVEEYLREFNIDINQRLDMMMWKNLMLCWILCVQAAQHDDIENWQNSMNSLQKAQAEEYQLAISRFQNQYLQQLEQYYDVVESAQRKEEAYRVEWEHNLGLQEQFYNAQLEFIKNQEQSAMTDYNTRMNMNPGMESRYLQELQSQSSMTAGNIKTVTLVYPASVTSSGAPVSGGAQPPTRRINVKMRRKQGCC